MTNRFQAKGVRRGPDFDLKTSKIFYGPQTRLAEPHKKKGKNAQLGAF